MADPLALPIRLAPFAGLAGSQMLHLRPPTRYGSTPPGLSGFVPADPVRARALLSLLVRPQVECPLEAVMLYRDAVVLDGMEVLARDGTGVLESFPLYAEPHHVAWQQHHLDRIAAGEVAQVAEAGPPVAAIFAPCAFNFGHVLVEMLPRLVLLAEAGLRRLRLLVPAEAEPLWPMAEFALRALGMDAEKLVCPAGTAIRVPALHWVSPVARHEHRKSPTLVHLMEKLRAAAPRMDGPERLYVARPAGSRWAVANAAAVEQAARDAGFAVVEPSALGFPEQVALFAGARRILGPMGAALTLMAAMPPGEGSVAMLEGGKAHPFFWDLACLCGHRFTWGFTAPLTAFDMAMLERPIVVDPDLLAELLEGP